MKKKYCTYSKCFVFFPLERKRLWLFPILWPPAEENKWYIPFLLCLNTSHSGAPSTVKINAFMPATMWRQTLIFIGRHYRKWDFPFISWKQSSHQVPSSPEAKPNELLKDDGVLCFLLITFFFFDALMVGNMKMISQAVDPEIPIKWAQDTLHLAALGLWAWTVFSWSTFGGWQWIMWVGACAMPSWSSELESLLCTL